MTLTIKSRCEFVPIEEWNANGEKLTSYQELNPGIKVDYLGHIPGGMVKVGHAGQVVVIHPAATV